LGSTLTFSLLWRFEFGLSALSGLSLAVGIAMMRALQKLNISDVGLKWPNDLVTGLPALITATRTPTRSLASLSPKEGESQRGKIAGILIEAQGDMLGPSVVVIGIGLNLCLPKKVAERIDQPVSDLAHVMPALPERNYLIALLLQELADMLVVFARQGFAPLRSEWESYHLYQNRQVKMILPDNTVVAGIVRGITEDGALRVETMQGEKVFNAGEISLREA